MPPFLLDAQCTTPLPFTGPFVGSMDAGAVVGTAPEWVASNVR